MCVYSAIGPAFEPTIPIPTWPLPWEARKPKTAPWSPVPATGVDIAPADLRKLLDAFHAAVAAAKAADKASGQPDCVDGDKIKLEERVAELERRLDAIEKTKRRSSRGRKKS